MSEPERPKQSNDNWLTPSRFAALLAALVFAIYPEVFLGIGTFVYRDFGHFAYPIAYYLRESYWHGEIPLWNPLNNCGVPFLAQWNTQTLYPPALFYVLFPLSWALPVFCLLHLYLGGLGMFFLARHWTGNRFGAAFAGIAFAFSGLVMNSLMWPATIPGFGWMPWVVWLTERAWREGGRWVVVAALVGTLQILSGAVEVILMTWLLLLALWLVEFAKGERPRWQTLWRAGLVVIVITGVSAPQLMPFLDFLAHSNRQEDFNSANWPMPVTGWANFLAPLFQTHRSYHGVYLQTNQYWTASYYVGALTIGLAVWGAWLARKARTWLLVALVLACLVLAWGEVTPIYSWLRQHISAIGLMRYPVKFLILPELLLPLLAAFGIAEWQKRVTRQQAGFDRVWWWICAATILLLLGLTWYTLAQSGNDDRMVTVVNTITRLVFFIALVAGLVWLGKRTRMAQPWLVMLVVLLLGWLDVSRHEPRPPTVDRSIYEPNLQRSLRQPRFGEARAMVSHESAYELSHSFLADVQKDYLSRRFTLFNNCNLLDGIAKVDGFFPMQIRVQKHIHDQLYATNAPDPVPAPLLDFLGVSQISTPRNVYQWTPRSTFLPIVTAGQKPVFADETTTLKMLVKTDFDPRAEVYLPMEAKAYVTVTNAANVNVSVPLYSANRIEIESVRSDAPALLVVAQTYYHVWHVYVDGSPTRLLRANDAFQAVQVPAGTHRVTFIYEDRMFYIGAVISLMTLLACAVAWLVLVRRGKFTASPSLS